MMSQQPKRERENERARKRETRREVNKIMPTGRIEAILMAHIVRGH